jgi:ribonuclease Z
MGRKKTFYIHAHSDLVQILETVLKIGSQELSYKIEVIPLSFQNPETIFEDSKVKVTSFPLRHSIPVCGFLFEEKPRPRNVIKEFVESMQLTIKEMNELKSGLDIVRDGKVYKNSTLTKDPPRVRKYAFVTDTLKCSNIVEIIKDVDILYHEATYLHKDLDLARLSCHSTALQAAQIAHDSGAKKLLLGHYSSRYTDPKVIEEEAQTVFENSVATADGDVYILDNK